MTIEGQDTVFCHILEGLSLSVTAMTVYGMQELHAVLITQELPMLHSQYLTGQNNLSSKNVSPPQQWSVLSQVSSWKVLFWKRMPTCVRRRMLACVTGNNCLQLRKLPSLAPHTVTPVHELRPMGQIGGHLKELVMHEGSNTLVVMRELSLEFIANRGRGKRVMLRVPGRSYCSCLTLWTPFSRERHPLVPASDDGKNSPTELGTLAENKGYQDRRLELLP